MSLTGASEEYWSATVRCTIRERCKFMFNNEILSDVKFVVRDSEHGSESMKKIPAHKFLLAISSPVFHAMFYGELAEKKDSIDMSDCDHKSLLELFRFIYSDEVNLNADNVMQVLYLAKKYMLPSLSDKCKTFLGKQLNASNVFYVLPEAQKYEEKDLEDHCWKVIDKQTEEAVKSNGFVTIEKPILQELVERDSLNVKEVELFKAVDRWATKECKKQGLKAEGSLKRTILGERIVKAIRYPLMKEKEFVEVVLDSEILTARESFDMVKYFNSVLKVPKGFSESPRAGCSQSPRAGCPQPARAQSPRAGCSQSPRAGCPQSPRAQSPRAGCPQSPRAQSPRASYPQSPRPGCPQSPRAQSPRAGYPQSRRVRPRPLEPYHWSLFD